MTAIRSVVLGCGSYLPQQILTNAELAARIDTSDEWIVQRTGIRQRHIAAEGEFTSHLAVNAARAALVRVEGGGDHEERVGVRERPARMHEMQNRHGGSGKRPGDEHGVDTDTESPRACETASSPHTRRYRELR